MTLQEQRVVYTTEQMFDVIERTLADLGHADVKFTSSNFVIDDVNKTLGQLRLNAGKIGELIKPSILYCVFYICNEICKTAKRLLAKGTVCQRFGPSLNWEN